MHPKTAAAALVAFLLLAPRLPAQAKPAPYPHMASVESYLMPRADEVALARSAAPPSISARATVLVLTPQGYVTAVHGANGFVCFVERSWDSPLHSATFWNPKIRGANCLNPPAARSVLPVVLLIAKLALSRRTQAGIEAGLQAALSAHSLPKLEPRAMSYMLSKHSYLTNSGGNLAHVMFYMPTVAPGLVGAGFAGSPVDLAGQMYPVPVTVVIVSTPAWSDGSPAK